MMRWFHPSRAPQVRVAIERAASPAKYSQDAGILSSVPDAAEVLRSKHPQHATVLCGSRWLSLHHARLFPVCEDLRGQVPRNTAGEATLGVDVEPVRIAGSCHRQGGGREAGDGFPELQGSHCGHFWVYTACTKASTTPAGPLSTRPPTRPSPASERFENASYPSSTLPPGP